MRRARGNPQTTRHPAPLPGVQRRLKDSCTQKVNATTLTGMTVQAIDAARHLPRPNLQPLSRKPERPKPTQKPTAGTRPRRNPRTLHSHPVLLQYPLVGENDHRTLRLPPTLRPAPLARRSHQRADRAMALRLHPASPHLDHARSPYPAPPGLRCCLNLASATQNACAPAPQCHGVRPRKIRPPRCGPAPSPLLDSPLLRPCHPLGHGCTNQPRKLRLPLSHPHLHHEKRSPSNAPGDGCTRHPFGHTRPNAGCALRGATRTARQATGKRAPRVLPPPTRKCRHNPQANVPRPETHNGNESLRPDPRSPRRPSSTRSR